MIDKTIRDNYFFIDNDLDLFFGISAGYVDEIGEYITKFELIK
jgi:hypothetical protein